MIVAVIPLIPFKPLAALVWAYSLSPDSVPALKSFNISLALKKYVLSASLAAVSPALVLHVAL